MKTLKQSWSIVKFYETSRGFFNTHQNQLADDYELEMVRRAEEHRMDFEEYCLVVLHLMMKNKPRKNADDKLFEAESADLLSYYQNNDKSLKKTWNKDCDSTLFGWVLTSYDRFKADNRGSLSLSSLFNKK
jgi:hypothetical protein